jgi:oxygen-independent coproporphyrinogen-3 oxidase
MSDDDAQAQYFDRLVKEIELFATQGAFDGRRTRSVYFGGGTPTMFSTEQIGKLVELVVTNAPLTDGATVSVEATPGSLAKDRIARLRDAGIDRLSIGCQTFDLALLKLCMRAHTPKQMEGIIRTAHDHGMRLNVDIMLGLAGQTLESLEGDLAILEDLKPDAVEFIRHEIVNPKMVALYEAQPELLVSDDELFAMTLRSHQWSEDHGYEQNGRFTHDRDFPYRYHWLRGMPLLAFGARTRSYVNALCYENQENLTLYGKMIDRGLPPLHQQQHLSHKEQMYRAFFLRIQIRAGVDRAEFLEAYGEDVTIGLAEVVDGLRDLGAIEVDERAVRLTRYGQYFYEDVCCYIMDTARRVDFPEHRRTPFSYGNAWEAGAR